MRSLSFFARELFASAHVNCGMRNALLLTTALLAASSVLADEVRIIDGETGIIARTTEEFADAVSELIDDPEKAATYARRGRQLVSERFLITRYLGDYLRILTELHRGH